MAFILAASVMAASGRAADAPDLNQAAINRAVDLLKAGQATQAMPLLDQVLASFDRSIADASAKGRVFCATDPAESLLYLIQSAGTKTSSTVLGAALCDGLFYKAYALTELKREAEAVAMLEKLTAMAPMHAHYFIELGFAYRVSGMPDKAMAAYRKAVELYDVVRDKKLARLERAAGLRGIGYLLVDQGDLDGAEKAYRDSLKDDPESPVARAELEYVADKRRH